MNNNRQAIAYYIQAQSECFWSNLKNCKTRAEVTKFTDGIVWGWFFGANPGRVLRGYYHDTPTLCSDIGSWFWDTRQIEACRQFLNRSEGDKPRGLARGILNYYNQLP